MEEILNKLLLPDNEVIREASKQLKVAFKSDGAVPELCQVLVSTQSPQVRQYAAVLLRKRFTKAKHWNKMAESDRNHIKAGCLQALIDEPTPSVKSAVAQLIAVMAKHDLAKNQWPELMTFLDTSMKGNQLIGFQCLEALCDSAAELMVTHLGYLAPLMAGALQNETDRALGYYAVRALTHLAPYVGSDHIRTVQSLLPHVITLIKALLTANDERGCEAMDIFDDLIESEVTIVVPYIKPIMDLMLCVAGEKVLDDAVRVKAIVFLGCVTKMKKKSVIKLNLVERMIGVLFPVMCEPDEDEDEDDEPSQESSSPSVCACQTLDQLAINLPPGKFLPHLLKHVQAGLTSDDPNHVRAAFHAMAVSVEGCSEFIRHHHLADFFQFIATGIKNDNSTVRNAALYALGQASEFLQPDINAHVNEFLPVLVNYLDGATAQLQGGKEKVPGLDRIFYALEVFSENLGADLVPYLEELLKRLVQLIGPQFSNHVQELAISLIGSAAASVEEAIAPYAKDIIAHLQPYLTMDCNEENQVLLMQSMDTLGSLARAIGPTGFAPELAGECANLSMNLLEKYDDPDVRKSCYSLLVSVATVMKENMESLYPKLIPIVIMSVNSNEGISFELKEDDSGLPVEDLTDDEEEDGDEEDEISLGSEGVDADADLDNVKTISVENAFMEEKEQAIMALRGLCNETGRAFYPFIPDAFEAVWKTVDFPDEDIRRSSADALAQFTIAYFKIGEPAAKEFNTSVALVVPKLCTMVKEDEEVGVASTCLDALADMLKECKGAAVTLNHPEAIVATVTSVLKSECACMDAEGEDDDDDQPEAEQDEALFDYAGDILPALGMAMSPPTFLPVFQSIYPLLMKKTKKQCSPAERSFAIGSFAECMEPLQGCLEPFLQDFLRIFVNYMNDADKDVRNNSIFGLGELALHAGPSVVQHYPQLLQTLSGHLSKGDDKRCVDQVVGAVCRLVVANKAAVPLGDVVPVIFQHLPLNEDMQEYDMVYRCIETVYQDCPDQIKMNLQKIAEMSAANVMNKKVDAVKVKPLVQATMQALCKDYPEDMKVILSAVSPEVISHLGL